MSLPVIHFQTVRPDLRIVVRPLCGRAHVTCGDENSSPLRHEITCKLCLKRMTKFTQWCAQTASRGVTP